MNIDQQLDEILGHLSRKVYFENDLVNITIYREQIKEVFKREPDHWPSCMPRAGNRK